MLIQILKIAARLIISAVEYLYPLILAWFQGESLVTVAAPLVVVNIHHYTTTPRRRYSAVQIEDVRAFLASLPALA